MGRVLSCEKPIRSADLRLRMHDPVVQTGEWLEKVVRGYFQYHAVPDNRESLNLFREHLARLWRHVLRRRSQKRRPSWTRLRRYFDRWLPRPHILHPYPNVRFDAMHPRWEPYALVAPVRICAGGAEQSAFLPRPLVRFKLGDGDGPRTPGLNRASLTPMKNAKESELVERLPILNIPCLPSIVCCPPPTVSLTWSSASPYLFTFLWHLASSGREA